VRTKPFSQPAVQYVVQLSAFLLTWTKTSFSVGSELEPHITQTLVGSVRIDAAVFTAAVTVAAFVHVCNELRNMHYSYENNYDYTEKVSNVALRWRNLAVFISPSTVE